MYVSKFTGLKEINLASVSFEELTDAKAMVKRLPPSVENITVQDANVEELFIISQHMVQKEFKITCIILKACRI